jgi:hypothetical protein
MRTKTRRMSLGLLLVAALLLTACSAEIELTLYPEQEWMVTSTFTFDPRLMPEISVGGDIFAGIGLEVGLDTGAFSEAMLESSLNQLVAQYRSQGIEASWRKRQVRGGEIAYIVTAEGQGWDGLQAAVFQDIGLSLTQVGDEIYFTLPASADEMGLGFLLQQTFRLRGGRIISSNAQQVKGGTAIWYNPTTTLEAVLTPAARFDLSHPVVIAGLVVIGLGAVGTAAFFLLRFRTPRPPGRGPRPPRPRPSYYPRRPTRPHR